MNREQKNVIDLFENGKTRKEITKIINKEPLVDDISYDKVKCIVRDFTTGHLFNTPQKPKGKPRYNGINTKILHDLNEDPIASTH